MNVRCFSCSVHRLGFERVLPCVWLVVTGLLGAISFAGEQQDPAAGPPLDLLHCIDLALAHDPEIALAREDVALAEAALGLEGSLFDYQFEVSSRTQRERIPLANGNETDTDKTEFNSSLVKTFRSGIEFNPSLLLERTDPHHNTDDTLNTARLALSLSYPLLRGRGRHLVTGRERAAARELSAGDLQWHHRVAQRTLATITAYWAYLAEYRRLEVVERSEARSNRLVKETKALIEAGEVPENELLQLLANANEKRAIRIDTQNGVFQARHNLGLVMGLGPVEIASLAAIEADFPASDSLAAKPLPSLPKLIEAAFAKRSDLRALQLQGEADEIRHTLASDSLKPDLRVSLETSYDTLRAGSGFEEWLAALTRRTPGANYAVGLTYKLPLGRQAAKSELGRTSSQLRRTMLSREDLERRIGLQVMTSYEDLRRALETLAAVDQSVEYYELAVTNERKKLKLGFSTLIDLISYEDRLTSVLLRRIDSRARLWQALAQLQFETGTFSQMDVKSGLNRAQILALPDTAGH